MQNNRITRWRPAGQPPKRQSLVVIRLGDGRRKTAEWTGVEWWCDGTKVTPQAWSNELAFEPELAAAGK